MNAQAGGVHTAVNAHARPRTPVSPPRLIAGVASSCAKARPGAVREVIIVITVIVVITLIAPLWAWQTGFPKASTGATTANNNSATIIALAIAAGIETVRSHRLTGAYKPSGWPVWGKTSRAGCFSRRLAATELDFANALRAFSPCTQKQSGWAASLRAKAAFGETTPT